MRCYLVQGGGRKRYAATVAASVEARNAIIAETGIKKKDVEVEQADIPMGKAELLVFVNELCEALDTPKDAG
jgi:hypothetical protein